MAELPSVITIESDTVPAIEACEPHLHHLARLNTAELVVTAVSRESDRGLANKPDLTSTVTTEGTYTVNTDIPFAVDAVVARGAASPNSDRRSASHRDI